MRRYFDGLTRGPISDPGAGSEGGWTSDVRNRAGILAMLAGAVAYVAFFTILAFRLPGTGQPRLVMAGLCFLAAGALVPLWSGSLWGWAMRISWVFVGYFVTVMVSLWINGHRFVAPMSEAAISVVTAYLGAATGRSLWARLGGSHRAEASRRRPS